MNSWKWTRRLRRIVDAVEEQVHQHRLAAPDAAPQIDAARRLGLAAERAPQHAAALRRRFELGLRARRAGAAAARLFGIGAELAGGDQRVDSGRATPVMRRAVGGGVGLRIVPEKLAIVVARPARPARAGTAAARSRAAARPRASSGSPIAAAADELRRQVERHRRAGRDQRRSRATRRTARYR